MKKLKKLSLESLIYVDETGIDQCFYREYERTHHGQKVAAKINGRKFKRANIAAGICQGKWAALLEYSGTIDRILFEFWFEVERSHCQFNYYAR